MPYSGFIANTTLQPPTLLPAPPRAPQPELINYSNTPQFSTHPIIFANTDKTNCSELPQPIHTVSNIHDTPQDIILISDTSFSDPLSSQFSSPTTSRIESNPFNQPQGPVTNIERLLSQANCNHSFNIVNSSQSFQSSLPLSFQGTPIMITLRSNLPTPDIEQHSRHCIGKQPDTTRTYPTITLKLDPKFVVLALVLFGDHNNGEQLHNWAKPRISKLYKITQVQKQRELTNYLNNLKLHFRLKL